MSFKNSSVSTICYAQPRGIIDYLAAGDPNCCPPPCDVSTLPTVSSLYPDIKLLDLDISCETTPQSSFQLDLFI